MFRDHGSSDLNLPSGCRPSGKGYGGIFGWAKGRAVRLWEAGPRTLFIYRAEAKIGGRLVQLIACLLNAVAEKLADEFASVAARLGAALVRLAFVPSRLMEFHFQANHLHLHRSETGSGFVRSCSLLVQLRTRAG